MIAFAREALGLSPSHPVTLSALRKRGSDRAYFRLSYNPGNTAILVAYDPVRVENAYWADIALFLSDLGVPVPGVVRHDPEACLIVMEDLGDRDLASFAGASWETLGSLYRKTLSAAHRLHSFPATRFPAGRVRLMDAFGPDLYRWERTYFMDHFVRDLCGIELPPAAACRLERELSALAERLSASAPCLVHRDLQSQNVMIRRAEIFLIDFQGMRFGSAFYDLGSLLCDAYAGLSEDRRSELLSFYYALAARDEDWAAFQEAFWAASAQRLMQALGAYGNLGLKKGLASFLAHIPSGLGNLVCATGRIGSVPRLHELAGRCLERLPGKLPTLPTPGPAL